MSLADDLLQQAHRLRSLDRRRPRQANLRRAVSSAYYALFHGLIEEAVLAVVGARSTRRRIRVGVSRAFSHATMKKAANAFLQSQLRPVVADMLGGRRPSRRVRHVAEAFLRLQQGRHEADYALGRVFTRDEVRDLVEAAQRALAAVRGLRRTDEGRVFLLSLLVYDRLRGS